MGINRLWIEFEIGDKTRVIAIHEIVSSLPQTLCASLPFFHAFTGCDTVSSFFEFSKKKAWDCWMLNLSKFCDLFSSLDFSSLPSSFNALEKFVITLYCKNSDAQNVDECRCNMFSSGYPVEKLPPTSAALAEHTRRAMYQSEIRKSCLTKIQNRPSPLDWGWAFNDSEELIPFWSCAQSAASIHEIIHHCNCKSTCCFRCSCKKKVFKMHQSLFVQFQDL